MFKQLRNKLLLLNLSILMILMLVSFSSIYLFTYNDVHKSIQMELHRIADFNNKPKNDFSLQPPDNNDFEKGKGNLPKRSVSFILLTTPSWELVSSTSFFDMDNSFYENAINSVKMKGADTGSFELDGNYWGYLVLIENDGYRIIYMDITSQHNVLANMIITFLVVAVVTFCLIFLISLFLTNKSIQPIKEAFDKQKQFIADASHEIKTPLAVINTNVDVLLNNPEQTIESQSKWLSYIKSETERMSKLTNDLLYLTRVDHSQIELQKSDFILSDILETTLLAMEAVVFEKNIVLDYQIEPNIWVHGNQEQITQLAMILLDNAIKYTPDAGKIMLTLNKVNNAVSLMIKNTGEGISTEQIDKIFDRFYRTDPSRTRESGGYGLGLSIAKAIVEQHDGKITVESTLGKFTKFTVKLPVL